MDMPLARVWKPFTSFHSSVVSGRGERDLSVFDLLLCLIGQHVLDIIEYRSLVSPAQLAVFFRGFSFLRRLSFYSTIAASLIIVGLACDAR